MVGGRRHHHRSVSRRPTAVGPITGGPSNGDAITGLGFEIRAWADHGGLVGGDGPAFLQRVLQGLAQIGGGLIALPRIQGHGLGYHHADAVGHGRVGLVRQGVRVVANTLDAFQRFFTG